MSSKGFIMFSISGAIGTFLFTMSYELLYRACVGSELLATSSCGTPSWVVSYALSMWYQHGLHRLLVFGPIAPYWISLFGTVAAYSLSLLLSSLLNLALAFLAVNHYVAFVISLISTGIINYLTVSKAFEASSAAAKKSEGDLPVSDKRTD